MGEKKKSSVAHFDLTCNLPISYSPTSCVVLPQMYVYLGEETKLKFLLEHAT